MERNTNSKRRRISANHDEYIASQRFEIIQELNKYCISCGKSGNLESEILMLCKTTLNYTKGDALLYTNLDFSDDGIAERLEFNVTQNGKVIEQYAGTVAILGKDGHISFTKNTTSNINFNNTNHFGNNSSKFSNPISNTRAKFAPTLNHKVLLFTNIVLILAVGVLFHSASVFKSDLDHVNSVLEINQLELVGDKIFSVEE